jgi:hypothetical protein
MMERELHLSFDGSNVEENEIRKGSDILRDYIHMCLFHSLLFYSAVRCFFCFQAEVLVV